MKSISNYINGELIAPTNGNYLDLYDPSTGQVYSKAPDSDITDVQNAVDAAEQLGSCLEENTQNIEGRDERQAAAQSLQGEYAMLDKRTMQVNNPSQGYISRFFESCISGKF